MGAWGTGIFQDDTACDIRDDYKDYLGDGLSGPEATTRILSEYKSSFADPDESGVAWLALAAVQWRHGRLDETTLEQALRVIDSGSNLAWWADSRTSPNAVQCSKNSAQRLVRRNLLKRRSASRFAHPAIGRLALSSPIASSPAISPYSVSSDFTPIKAEPLQFASCSIGQGLKRPRRRLYVP